MPLASKLAEKVRSEVAACIGCHDCLLACPLPEASLVGIAELNAAVRLPLIRSPNLVRFLTACTQCGQCVPACPADLSRADMVLYNKAKVEDAVPDHLLPLQVEDRIVPSAFTLDALTRELAALSLFAGVPPADVRRLLLKVTLRGLAPRAELCREGEYHERLVIVLSGALEQISGGAEGRRVRILVLGPGSFLGEMAVMADQPEPFTVVAETASIVVEAPKAAVHRLMDAAPTFRDTMESLYARRALYTYAARPGALGGLPARAIEELFAAATLEPLDAGQTLLREGARPEHVYLARAGFLRVTRRAKEGAAEEVLGYFREGDLFGALPLILDEPAQAFTVQAVGRAEVIRIAGAVFRRVAGGHPELRSSALEAERGVRAQGEGSEGARGVGPLAAPPWKEWARVAGGSASPSPRDVFVEEGLAEGRELLAIDQTRCTACNSCVDACGRRHGMSRLELRGIQVGPLLFPTACRHCDDPVCLLCSVSGIVRRPGGEIAIVEDNCIGCGACADRCPYGNIRIHPVEPDRRGLLRRFYDYLRGPGDHDAPGERDPAVPRKAVKCDLCEGHDDYACVTACPVGAAFRVDPGVFAGGDVFAGARGR